jgi:hypothetical protein
MEKSDVEAQADPAFCEEDAAQDRPLRPPHSRGPLLVLPH